MFVLLLSAALSDVEIVSVSNAKEDPLWEEKEEKGEDDEHDWRDDAGEPVDMDGFWSLDEGESDME